MRILKVGAILSSLLMASVASAAVLSVDFNGEANAAGSAGTYTGSGPAPGTVAGTWRGVNFVRGSDNDGLSNIGTPSTGFLDANNNATSVSLSFAGFNFNDNYESGPAQNALLDDYLGHFDPAGAGVVTISGLVPGSQYSLYVFGVNSRGGANGAFSVNGSAVQTTVATGSVNNVATSVTPFTLNEDYVVFSNVAANSSGQLVLSDASGNGAGILNGFQLVGNLVVPEPTSMGMIAAGGLTFVRRRRA